MIAAPYAVASCSWNVPWAQSPADFGLGHRLTLTFADLRQSLDQPITYTYRIWQYDQFVEFNLDDDEFPRGSARRLAGSRRGQPFLIEAMTDPEVVIVVTYVKEQPWVIMSRIGYNA